MSSMEKLREVIIRRVFNRDPIMPAEVWAKAYDHIETDITAEKIQAEIDLAKQALAEMEASASADIEQLRNREEADSD